MNTNHDSSARLPHVRTHVDHGVAWIELDNAAKLNAMSVTMWRQMIESLGHCRADPVVRCVVITGSGSKAFCTGADIAEKGTGERTAEASEALAIEALASLRSFHKPTVAVIKGYCLGAGMAIATSCDIRVAGRGATFGVPAAKLGLAVYYDVLASLTRLVGPSVAKLLLFTADRIDAPEALRSGLIERVEADEEVAAYGRQLAVRIADNAPLTIAAAKWGIDMTFADPTDRDMPAYLESERRCYASEDFVEGRLAFKERRPPVFNGR